VDRDEQPLTRLVEHRGGMLIPLSIDLPDTSACRSRAPRIVELVGRMDMFHAGAGRYIGGDLADALLMPGNFDL